MFPNNWRALTLQMLEKGEWGDVPDDSSYLIKRCAELSRIPLNVFTTEDLRIMIGQKFSLPYLLPLAFEKLEEDLFVQGDFYPGDLLENILKIPASFWQNNKYLYLEIKELIGKRHQEIEDEGIALDLFESVNL